MNWGYVAVAVALGCLAAWWLRGRGYRLADDTVQREINPWLVPVAAGAGAGVAGPFFADLPFVVVATYDVALVWAVVLAFIDLEVRRLPDLLVLPAYPVGAGLLTVCSAVTGDWAALLRAVTCAGAAVLLFLFLVVVSASKEGFGLGDAKLAGVLGALLGWMSWTSASMGLLTCFILGGIGALFLLISRRADRRASMSYGPAMILGAYVWSLLGSLA